MWQAMSLRLIVPSLRRDMQQQANTHLTSGRWRHRRLQRYDTSHLSRRSRGRSSVSCIRLFSHHRISWSIRTTRDSANCLPSCIVRQSTGSAQPLRSIVILDIQPAAVHRRQLPNCNRLHASGIGILLTLAQWIDPSNCYRNDGAASGIILRHGRLVAEIWGSQCIRLPSRSACS